MNRKFLTAIHRYVGLGMAMFLVCAGLSGSILVWHDELDSWLNPDLYHVSSPGTPLSLTALSETFERKIPGASLSFVELPRGAHDSVHVYARDWPSKMADGPVINEAFLHPATAEILGVRSSAEPGFSRQEIMRWIYRFHYSLTMGSVGSFILGFVALAWLFDAMIAFYLTLPRGRPFWQKWKPAWGIKRKRLNFDIHRASGLWLWPVFVMLAFTSVYFNLNREVFRPVVEIFTTITPKPFDEPPLVRPVTKGAIDWDQAVARAENILGEHGVKPDRLAQIGHYPARAYYIVGFQTSADISDGRAGARVYIDSRDGSLRHLHLAGEGSAGDVLVDWQFPLHSGQAFGLFGRLVIFIAGIAVTALSFTGIVIWWRKRRARLRHASPGIAARMIKTVGPSTSSTSGSAYSQTVKS